MGNDIDNKNDHEQLEPCDIPKEYYDFSHYVSKERILTYWHQADEILAKKPERFLEVGIGNKIVSSIVKCYGVNSVTADINESLCPDVVASITELDKDFKEGEFPFVLCARVLQHLPFSEFDRALSQLCYVTKDVLLLTLPVETICFYIRLRVTGRKPFTLPIRLPLIIKRIVERILSRKTKSEKQNFWKINQSREQSMANIKRIIENYFIIEKSYQVPEDISHAFFVLRKKR